MRHKLFFLAALAFAAQLYLFAQGREARLPNFWDDAPHEELAQRIAAAMTDEELLAQIFMFGWSGHEPSKELVSWVGERSLGNVTVFGWGTDNAQKVAIAANLLQEQALKRGRFGIPLFVATDQEGGIVRHIKGATSESPGNMALGASGRTSDAYLAGYCIASELAAIGVNMNLAPVADIYTSRESAVTGTRTFGDEPQAVARLSAGFAAGTREAGVLPAAKHFPGHGATDADSHKSLPEVNADAETLKRRELVPFAALINAGVPAIMSAHVSFPRVTGSDEPATFSSFILQDILRKELGFEGIIITDDIAMDGATRYAGSLSRAAELAILAGCDIILCSKTPGIGDALWTRNIEKLKGNAEFRDAVQRAATRVILLKLQYFKGGNSAPIYADIAKTNERVPSPVAERVFAAQARRSATLLYGGELLPIDEKKGGKILIAAETKRFAEAGLKRFSNADTAFISRGFSRVNLGEFGAVILELSSAAGLRVLNELSSRKGEAALIAVATDEPSLIARAKAADALLAVYSSSPYSLAAAFEAIAGDFAPAGSLPFSIEAGGNAR